MNQNQNPAVPTAELEAILFDPLTGQSSMIQPLLNVGISAQNMLLDSLGENLILISGKTCPNLWFASLSPSDGSVSLIASANITCGISVSPVAFDPAGNFVYVRFSDTAGTHIFDFSTGFELASSPLPSTLESEVGGEASPQGPYAYLPGAPPNFGISVFGVDPTTAYPVLPTSFTTPLFTGRELLVGPATANVNGQPVQVPAVGLSATSLDFGSITLGQTSSPQTVILTNTGGQALSLTSIQLNGSNVTDFIEADSCMASPQIQPNKSCSISITYNPSAVGSSSATVLITDNAAGSPQQINLSGAAIAPPNPTPQVTLNPNPFNFAGTTIEGLSSPPQNVVLTNSGNATLHVTSIVLGGTNAADFSIAANNCIGSLAANTSCTVSLVFSPSGPGLRAAMLTFTDDAPGSPHVLNIYGTATFAANFSGTTTASVSPGQTAQFNLQVIPGSGFNGTVSFTCTGAPFVATCNVPSNLSVSNGATTPFVVTVTTTAASLTPLFAPPAPPRLPPSSPLLFPSITLFSLFVFWLTRNRSRVVLARLPVFSALLLVLAIVLASGMGCGSGGSSSTPNTPPPVDPTPQATATPSMQPAGGTITTGFPTIGISDATPGATIYYTTDGSNPSTFSPVYTSVFTLNAPATAQAIATASGYSQSSVATATYKFQTPSGTSTLIVTPTAVPIGSSKQLLLNPIQLTLTIK